MKIYTIGVGAERFALGQRTINPSADLDEGTLAKIAEMTGGRYFRARDARGLASVYADIDRMEPVAGEPLYLSPTVTLFQWPLGAALVLSFLLAGFFVWPIVFPRRARAEQAPAPAEGARS